MKNRWMVAGLFGAGVVTGGAVAEWQLEHSCQCRSAGSAARGHWNRVTASTRSHRGSARRSASRSRQQASMSPIGTSWWPASSSGL